MFDMESRPTIVKLVVESADSGIESDDSTADSAIIPLKIGLWVRAALAISVLFAEWVQSMICRILYKITCQVIILG